jgi:outer membrane protein assembly factor BamB
MKAINRLTATIALFSLSLGSLLASDWPGFRGPRANGVSGDANVPAELTADNVVWKIKLPGPGASSPITSGDRVFVTCYTGYGTTLTKGKGKGDFARGGFGKGGFGRGGFGKGSFGKPDPADLAEQQKLREVILCLDRQTGQVLWTREVAPKLPEMSFTGMIREHGYATNTPVTDGERVYAFLGKTGVVAFDFAGTQLWQADVGSKFNHWGTASSPILHGRLVIVNAALESGALVALDKATGKEVWRTPGIGHTWSSPILVETKTGQPELVLNLPSKVCSYNPETGALNWHCEGITSSIEGVGGTYSSPVAQGDVVYVAGGGGGFKGQATALAIRTGGKGDVSKTHVLWRQKAGTSYNCPLVQGDFLYCIDGTVTCLRTDTGAVVYKERLYDSRGEYVSPVAAGDRIFALTRFDGLHTMAAGGQFEKVAHLPLEGDTSGFNASPALSAGRLYLRSNEYLYCIGKK